MHSNEPIADVSNGTARRPTGGLWYLAGHLPPELESKLWARTLRRIAAYFCYASLWAALPVAVFTVNGWLGLVVHGLALSGVIFPLRQAACSGCTEVSAIEIREGKGSCPAVKSSVS